MLNKNICIKCINKNEICNKWGVDDENKWNDGYVLCPIIYVRTVTYLNINDNPTDYCPYKLEHIVSDKEVCKRCINQHNYSPWAGIDDYRWNV